MKKETEIYQIMKTGLNPELIAQGSGPAGCYGIYQQ
jgi:hypothetical protein